MLGKFATGQGESVLTLSDLDRICPLPPEPGALPRVIGRHHAIALGYSTNAIRHRIENGSWRRVLPRTYLTSDAFTDRDRCDAALVFAGPGAALSGAAALVSSDVRGVRMPTRVLVLVPPGNRTRSNQWVQVRRTHRPIGVRDWASTWDRHLELTSSGHSVIHRPPSALKDQARFVADVRARLAGREAELRRG